MAGEMQIRVAAAYDLPRIAAIQSTAPEAARWNPQGYLQHSCVVAEIDGLVVAFLATRETTPGEREVLNMAVDPAFRRRGIAKRLLHPALEGEVFLEVRESNAAALGLYRALGFQAAGRRRAYYCDPDEDAIVMRFFS